jgi:hypothetical protein
MQYGETALFGASYGSKWDSVKLLVNRGADVTLNNTVRTWDLLIHHQKWNI